MILLDRVGVVRGIHIDLCQFYSDLGVILRARSRPLPPFPEGQPKFFRLDLMLYLDMLMRFEECQDCLGRFIRCEHSRVT